MPYPDDYDPRRNPQNHRLNDEQLRQVEGTHDVLDLMEALKPHLDRLTAKYGLPDGEAYYLFSDAFSDLGHAVRGGLDITEQPYREERAAIREWDAAVTERAAQRRADMERLWQGPGETFQRSRDRTMSEPHNPIDGIARILRSKEAGVGFSRAQVAAIAGIASSLVSTMVWQWLYFGRVDERREHGKGRE